MPNRGSQRDLSPSPSPSETAASSPRTPDRSSLDKPHRHSLHRQNATTTPGFSPLASPSISLPSLGMSPFTPTRRQGSPPYMDSSPSPGSGSGSEPRSRSRSRSRSPRPSQDSFALGSRITLIQRLTDLAMKINQENREEDGSLDKLHALMDQMESAISDHDQNRDARLGNPEPSGPSPEGNGGDVVQGSHVPEKPMHDRSDSAPPVEPLPSGKESHEPKSDAETQPGRTTRISGVDAERIVAEAQTLCKGLEDVVANLKARQEESDARIPPPL